MKKGLFLYGANCTLDVWSKLSPKFSGMDITYAVYPHEVTQKARSVSSITEWVNKEYGDTPYDFIVGHSMGGIAALELSSEYGAARESVIFIDTNLKPANEFYRNLMTPANMDKYGGEVMAMIKSEAPYYSEELTLALREDFDYTGYLEKITCAIYGIYGDRGNPGYARRISDLCLGPAAEEKISFMFVENSCHMPMVENPEGLAEVIMRCVG